LYSRVTERFYQMFLQSNTGRKQPNSARCKSETREFRNLERTYTTLAENEEWMSVNIDKIIAPPR
jgi:hypothetical protein